MKLISLLCLLITCSIYSAEEEPCFLIRFKDKPNITYRIKIEMVKNVTIRAGRPDKYVELSHRIDNYKQKNDFDSFVEPYLTFPQDAQYVRISVRSELGFKKGWRLYLYIPELRNKMKQIKTDKITCPGVRIEHQFERVLQNKALEYTVVSDSILIQSYGSEDRQELKDY